NSKNGEYAVIDYKTSDSARDPLKTRGARNKIWYDLQLPAYGLMLRRAGLAERFQFAYFNLGADLQSGGLKVAEWSPDDIASAEARIHEISADIVAQKFWPPNELNGFDEFNLLLGYDDVFLDEPLLAGVADE